MGIRPTCIEGIDTVRGTLESSEGFLISRHKKSSFGVFYYSLKAKVKNFPR